MVKVFLDANVFIDSCTPRSSFNLKDLKSYSLVISTLSVHIYVYSYKIKMPLRSLQDHLENFFQISLDQKILDLALQAPMKDLEDNIQLHSAAQADCDIFLTNDKKLLDLKFFGKMKILSTIS